LKIFIEELEHFCILIVYIDRGDKIAVQKMFTKNIFKMRNKSKNFAIYRVKEGKNAHNAQNNLTIHGIYGIL
jgi:stalled ribosome rescue protein Dom34